MDEVSGVVRPGEQLAEELKVRGWSQLDFARILGRDPKVINEIVTGARGITPRTANEFAAAFGTTPKYWLDLEAAYQLSHVGEVDNGIARRARLFKRAPVLAEMIRRGWIEPSDDVEVLERRVLRFFGIQSLEDEPELWPHAARKSSSYSEVTAPQWAWLFRARQLAMATQAEPFTPSKLDGALAQLKTLLQHAPEARRIPGLLAAAGIRLVLVEPLTGSKIDGACFWLDSKSPVVALSIRFDRIDSFWHTLMHEVAHVRAQDGLRGETVPIDVDLVGDQSRLSDKPPSEKAADAFAVSYLVDPAELQSFIVRVGPLYSRQRIVGFAGRIKVHPGIVVGQLQHRGEIGYAQNRSLLAKVRETVATSAITDGWGFTPTLTTRERNQVTG